MYKLVKNMFKKSGKSKKYDELIKVTITQDDLTYSGRHKLAEALREIAGDPNLTFETMDLTVPIRGFDYEDHLAYKEWKWEE